MLGENVQQFIYISVKEQAQRPVLFLAVNYAGQVNIRDVFVFKANPYIAELVAAQLLYLLNFEDVPFLDDRHPVAELLYLAEDMG